MGFQLPEVMPTDTAALEELRADAVKEFNRIYDPEVTPTEGEFADLNKLHDAIAQIDELLQVVVEEAQAAADADADKDEEATASNRADAAAEMASKLAAPAKEAAAKEEPAKEEPAQEKEQEPTDFSKAATGKAPEMVPAKKEQSGFRLTTSAKNYETGMVDVHRVAEEFNSLAKGGMSRVVGQNGQSRTMFA